MDENYTKVSDIPIPDDLDELKKIEFIAFRDALSALENEWNALEDNNNPHQKECINLLNEIRDTRKQQASVHLNLRLKVIDEQVKRNAEKINFENENITQVFHDRIMRAYYSQYQNLIGQLRGLMSEDDFNSYMKENEIQFPSFPDDNTMKTRQQESENLKIRISPQEIEDDLHVIQSKLVKEDTE